MVGVRVIVTDGVIDIDGVNDLVVVIVGVGVGVNDGDAFGVADTDGVAAILADTEIDGDGDGMPFESNVILNCLSGDNIVLYILTVIPVFGGITSVTIKGKTELLSLTVILYGKLLLNS